MSEATSSRRSLSKVCILLLGKTGHGKSATANTILGTKKFISSPSTESVTYYADVASRTINDSEVKVVDTPGLGDTKLDDEEGAKLAMQGFTTGVALCPEGFHALVVVFKLGQRMTNEEKTAIKSLKEMLGENILQDYGVLVFTHGDNFDEEEVGAPFLQWCQGQGGYLKELLEEFGNRCILFNNKTKDKSELSRQRQELLDCIYALNSKGKRYTNWLFDEAKKTWEKLARQKKYADIIDKVDAGLDDILSDLDTVREGRIQVDNAHFDRQVDKLNVLRREIAEVEDPEKSNMEVQIKDMEMRIQSVKAQKTEEARKSEMVQLQRRVEEMQEQHKKQIQDYQDQYRNLHEMMRENLRKEEKQKEAELERKREAEKKSGGCIIS